MWTISELKFRGKADKSVNYWSAVIVSLILDIIVGGRILTNSNSSKKASSEVGGKLFSSLNSVEILIVLVTVIGILLVTFLIAYAIRLLLINPLSTGCSQFFLFGTNEQTSSISSLTYAFQNNYKNQILVIFMRDLFVGLWTLLFVIPGIIKAYEYRMVPYILAENSDINYRDALAMSKEMMNGEKFNAFLLDLSFIGWEILSVFTFGLLYIFYVGPYLNFTNAELYVALKNKVAN